jgi:TIR domain
MSEGSDLKSPVEVKASVKAYFERDHNLRHSPNSKILTAIYSLNFDVKEENSVRQWTIAIERKLNFDFGANTIHSTFYIPELDPAINIPNLCQQLVGFFINDPLNFAPPSLREELRIKLNEFDRLRSTKRLIDARQIVLYIDADVSEFDKDGICQFGDSQGMSVIIRDRRYAYLRLVREKHLVFISHDSRDKASIARPLADELMKVIGRVWFDEYSLILGASLRESIERGLRECDRCILIPTPNFLSNTG